MHVGHLVNRLYSEHKFRHVEPGLTLRENLLVNEPSHEVSSREEFHAEVEVVIVLEGIMQLHNPLTEGEGWCCLMIML